jgi:hypothetical protein
MKVERVRAVMIEIRRDLYIDESTGFLNERSTVVQERLKNALMRWLTLSGEMVPPFSDSSAVESSIGKL